MPILVIPKLPVQELELPVFVATNRVLVYKVEATASLPFRIARARGLTLTSNCISIMDGATVLGQIQSSLDAVRWTDFGAQFVMHSDVGVTEARFGDAALSQPAMASNWARLQFLLTAPSAGFSARIESILMSQIR